MPYGRKARTVRAFKFGCLAPTSGRDEAIEAMHGRLALWNALVALDRDYVPRREEIVAQHITVTPPQGKASDWTPEQKECYKQWRAERKAVFKRDDVKAALCALDKQEYEDARQLWLASGLYWVNHEEVKITWQNARKRPGELRFHAWAREVGKASVRWQTGLPVADVFAREDMRLRLDPVAAEAYTSPVRGERRRLSRSVVSLRVASDERQPVWITLPVVLHRPLPPDGLIRSASVLWERLASHERWTLVLIVETPEETKAPTGHGTIGLDVGWRIRSEGLRVAYWHDEAGASGEVLLSQRWLAGMRKVEDLQSIRDQHFNAARATLITWLHAQTVVPAWLSERAQHLAQWRSIGRLASVVLFWRDNRFPGDTEMYDALEAWRRKDKHLWEWLTMQRDQLLAQRREQYRCFAAWVARTYATVRLEDFDLRPVARRKKKSEEADIPDAARHYRVLAAVSGFRLALKNACTREGVAIEEVEAAYTTRVCSVCGALEDWDKRELRHTCSGCGANWDQDWGGARNILDGGVSQKEAVLAQ